MREAPSDSHLKGVRDEISEIYEKADALARLLPDIADPGMKRKAEQLIQLCRVHTSKLSEYISEP